MLKIGVVFRPHALWLESRASTRSASVYISPSSCTSSGVTFCSATWDLRNLAVASSFDNSQ